ncbi:MULTISPECIES: tripartite tricarboxylate transporter TctB family protein [unclassified Sedimentibacter]|uniref:tripartite tricarboxylate transporter TctB family protein n=1 Tax=unclassified Sedimentibacter TaxID=2649220 RepID=UPI0027E06A31|nr:tripartite tricarboxylate transporter TctB family protein [Sedimentibacter sp. MB35-C1]WMJ76883.1 tripartite tricarboxylate transporter TctB family protein [Sedimentibacter sp. MB35-C1]
MKNRIDFFSGLAIIAFSILLFSMTGNLPAQSSLFPKALSVLFGVLGLMLVFNGRKINNSEEKNPSFGNKEMWIGLGLIITYIVLMNVTGFFTATALFIIAFMLVNKVRSVIKIGVTVVALNIFIYFIFVAQLNVPLPQGLLF